MTNRPASGVTVFLFFLFLTVASLASAASHGPSTAIQQEGAPTQIDSCTSITEPGRYALTANISNATATCLTIQADDVVLDGNGHVIDANRTVIENRTVGNAQLREAFVDALETRQTRPTPRDPRWAAHGVFVDGAANVTVGNVEATDWVYGIAVVNSSNSTVTEATVRDTETGIGLYQSTGVSVENASLTNNSVGAAFDTGRNNTITGSEVNESHFDGIELLSSGNATVTASTVSNTTVYDGIYVANASGTVVRGNDVRLNNLTGVAVVDGSRESTIANNSVAANGLNGILVFRNATENTLHSNDLTANAHSGIALVAGADGNEVTDNTVVNTTGTDAFTATANYTAGIVVNQSSGNEIRGNTLYGNAHSGISLVSNANENTLDSNVIGNTTEVASFDLTLQNPAGVLVERSSGNRILDTYLQGVAGLPYYSDENATNNTARNFTMATVRRYNQTGPAGENFSRAIVAATVSFTGHDVGIGTNVTDEMIEPDWSPRQIGPRLFVIRTGWDAEIENVSVEWRLAVLAPDSGTNATAEPRVVRPSQPSK